MSNDHRLLVERTTYGIRSQVIQIRRNRGPKRPGLYLHVTARVDAHGELIEELSSQEYTNRFVAEDQHDECAERAMDAHADQMADLLGVA